MRKMVLVTGASRGIGKKTAYALAAKGYDLYLVCSQNTDRLISIAKDIEEEFRVECHCGFFDIGLYDDCVSLCTEIEALGGVYGIVNNAAISYVGLMSDMSVGDWNRVMNVNLNSAFYICKKLVPSMVRNKEGRIVNVSSVWGSVGASMEVAYSTSKGGLNAFTKALAKELGPSNVKVNAVSFGVINTDMNKCFSEEDMEELRKEIPADRIGSAEEAAQMIVNVLEAPDYMTGQIITMDGGWI